MASGDEITTWYLPQGMFYAKKREVKGDEPRYKYGDHEQDHRKGCFSRTFACFLDHLLTQRVWCRIGLG
ncbi:hypothetical protein RSAG8_09240, partial [Rhizoctonia solani AG-8 WAC10335]